MSDAKRDANYVTTLLAVSNVDGVTPVVLYADPVTHRLLTSASGGGTGDVVGPASATDNAIVRFDATTGQLIQNSGITIDDNNNISLPASAAASSNGTFYKGTITAANRFIHNYYGAAPASGFNTFVGLLSGNFTLASGGVNAWESSYNTGIGASNLTGITTGYYNTAVGAQVGTSITTGSNNTAIGTYSLRVNVTGGSNVVIGGNSAYSLTSSLNTFVGTATGYNIQSGGSNVIIGANAGYGTTANNTQKNVIIGTSAGFNITTNSQANTFIGHNAGYNTTSGAYNIILGTTTTGTLLDLSSATASNEMNIGGAFFGNLSAKSFGIGLTDATSITARLHLPAGSTAASSGPLKFTSGSLQTSAEPGTMEFLTDAYYLTITTGAARQQIVTDTNTVTMSNKTLTAPKIANGGFIADANGNELIIFTTTASAVNEATFANAGTGGNPKFSATGGDSNIGIDFQTKGTGTYRLLGTSSQAAELRLYEDTDDGTNYTAFKVGTQAGDITYTLPTAVGSAGSVLTDAAGNGVLSWTTVGSGFSSRMRAKRGSTQSITDSTYTKVQFNTEDYDSSNEYDNATNFRFTATSAGYYLITSNIRFVSIGDGKVFRIAIYKNGTKIGTDTVFTAGVATDPSCMISDIQSLSASDYIEIFVFHNQGSTLDIYQDSYLAIHRLS